MLIRGYAAMAAAAASGSPASVAIVGGGVAGVSAAKLLATRGVPSVIYDQREMLGGRLGVTRLADGSYCGSACCYMKGSAAHGFQEQLLNWEAAGLVEEWDPVCASFSPDRPGRFPLAPDVKPAGERWYVGSPRRGSPVDPSGFSALEKEHITVRTGTTVVATVFEQVAGPRQEPEKTLEQLFEQVLAGGGEKAREEEEEEGKGEEEHEEEEEGEVVYGWRVESRPAEDGAATGYEQKVATLGGGGDSETDSALHTDLILAMPVDQSSFLAGGNMLLRALPPQSPLSRDFVKCRYSAVLTFAESLDLPMDFGFNAAGGGVITVIMKRKAAAGSGSIVGGLHDAQQEAHTMLPHAKDASGEAEQAGEGAVEVEEQGGEVWVVQTDTEWAARHDTFPSATVGQLLREELARLLGREELPRVLDEQVALWQYGEADYQLLGKGAPKDASASSGTGGGGGGGGGGGDGGGTRGCAHVPEQRIAFCGDWALNGRAEAAWVSGRAAARACLESRSKSKELLASPLN